LRRLPETANEKKPSRRVIVLAHNQAEISATPSRKFSEASKTFASRTFFSATLGVFGVLGGKAF